MAVAGHSGGQELDGDEQDGEAGIVAESFLLRTLRDIVMQHIMVRSEGSDGGGPRAEGQASSGDMTEATEQLDGRMETLWDLCADPRLAAFLVCRGRAVAILAEAAARALRRCVEQLEPDKKAADVRCAEVCLGALANICTHKDLVAQASDADVSALVDVAIQGIGAVEGVVVLQGLRLSCTLLMGPAFRSCDALWSNAAAGRYVYVLENSMLWEVVQHACDTLSQALVLDCRAAGAAASSDEDQAALRLEPQGTAMWLANEGLAAVLAQRLGDLATAAAGDVETLADAGEGDPQTALLSALCLCDSFLAAVAESPSSASGVGGIPINDVATLASACLRVLASASRPEVITAALELMSSLFDLEASLPDGGHGAVGLRTEPVGGDDGCTSAAAIRPQVRQCLSGALGPGIIEKLIFSLQDQIATVEENQVEDGEDSAGIVALLLLDLAPWERVEEYKDVLVAAAKGFAALTTASCGVGLEVLSGTFRRRLQLERPERCDVSADAACARRACSRSRSR